MKTEQEVYDIIQSEVEYARQKWENDPTRPIKDAGKSVEFWIAHAENYLHRARMACYGTDKTEAFDNLRKLMGLLVRAFMFSEFARKRTQQQAKENSDDNY